MAKEKINLLWNPLESPEFSKKYLMRGSNPKNYSSNNKKKSK